MAESKSSIIPGMIYITQFYVECNLCSGSWQLGVFYSDKREIEDRLTSKGWKKVGIRWRCPSCKELS